MSDPQTETRTEHGKAAIAATAPTQSIQSTQSPASIDSVGFARRSFADQLSIDTPEGVALTFPVAGIGSRFAALLLDTLLQVGVISGAVLLLAIPFEALRGPRDAGSLAGKWFIALSIFAGFLLFWGYFTLFEAFWHGQTPGKRAMKLRVIQDSGRGLTPFEGLARNLLRVVDFLPGLYLAGVVTMLANKRNKRLGDLAAGTLVIHDRPENQPLFLTGGNGTGNFFTARQPQTAATGTPRTVPADRISRLSTPDLTVIEAFFARALDLPLDVRAAIAEQILSEMVAKMDIPRPDGKAERTLEEIALGLRAGRRRL